jgi:beta-galactosidase GanA
MFLRRFLVTVMAGKCLIAAPCAAAQLPYEQIEYGADYNAEDWPRERVETDAWLMEEAKFRVVCPVDTNWERPEPEECRHHFAWLDRPIDILRQHGIRTALSTTPYLPPAWLSQKHPEFYLVKEDSSPRRCGGIGSICLNNPFYRQYEWPKLDQGPEIPDGVDDAVRQKDQRSFHFVLNFGESPKTVKLPGEYRELLSGKVFADQVTVPRLDLWVLVENPSKAPKAH